MRGDQKPPLRVEGAGLFPWKDEVLRASHQGLCRGHRSYLVGKEKKEMEHTACRNGIGCLLQLGLSTDFQKEELAFQGGLQVGAEATLFPSSSYIKHG